jgi:hypothetical protein
VIGELTGKPAVIGWREVADTALVFVKRFD